MGATGAVVGVEVFPLPLPHSQPNTAYEGADHSFVAPFDVAHQRSALNQRARELVLEPVLKSKLTAFMLRLEVSS